MLQIAITALSASIATMFMMRYFTKVPIFKDNGGEMKMVLVVRTDLKMTKGKIAAQCCHACLSAYEEGLKRNGKMISQWKLDGQTKIALKIDNESELLNLYKMAKQQGIIAAYIKDAGRTQIPSGSITVLAVGPGPLKEIDKITGDLKLL